MQTAIPGTAAVPGTAIGTAYGLRAGGAGGAATGPQEGNYTATIYGLIREQRYADAARILSMELQNFPRSRAALSLLAYCYYYMQDFRSAALTYEQLVRLHPEVDDYKLYYAQALYKAGLYEDALRAASRVDGEEHTQRLLQLQAAIKYEMDDLAACKSMVDQCAPEDPDTLINQACITYKEGEFEKARQMFSDAMNTLGYQADLAYNVALCHYCMKQYAQALRLVADIIERGVREHPELSVGSNTDGIEVRAARGLLAVGFASTTPFRVV